MKKQSLFSKLFKKSQDEIDEAPEPLAEKSSQPENFPEILVDIPMPEMDEKKAIGKLEIYVSGEKVSTHTIESHTKIGRDPSQADIIISELIVSKLHCTFYQKDGRVYVQDNDSTNGTYIDKQRVKVHALADNTRIGLGRKGTVEVVFFELSGGS